MPRAKKQRLKQRADGRYACRYKDQWFYGASSDEALDAREAYKLAELAGEKPPSQVTVREYAGKWLPVARAHVARSTYNESVAQMEKLLDELGDELICAIKPTQIKGVWSARFLGYSNSYIKGSRTLYAGLFDAAVADGICTVNPVRSQAAAPHKGTFGGHRAITPQEREWIQTLCTDHRAWPAVMTMLYAGLRPAEVKALDIDKSVDLEQGVIRLTDFVHLDGSNHYKVTERGKTDLAAREIPIFAPLREALKDRHGLLIPSASGKQVSVRAWRTVWDSYVSDMEAAINGMQKRWYRRTREHKAILAEAGKLRAEGRDADADAVEAKIPPWIPFTVRPYDLRHSFAAWCRDNHVELNTVVRWMGHADATMVLRVYDEVSDSRSAAEAARLEAILNGSQNGSQDPANPAQTQ